jgi:peptide/nickel transport system substrate-binding protein
MKAARWIAMLAVCLVVGGLLGAAQETPVEGGTLVLWMSQAPNTFLGYYSLGDQARYPCDMIYDKLYEIEPSGEFYPRLAVGYEISDDQLTYTFYLHPDATWHDGTPVTADDVRFTVEVLGDPEFTGSNAGDVDPIAGIDEYRSGDASEVSGIEIVDEKTIQITLSGINVPFFEMFASQLWILPEHILGQMSVADLDQSTFALNPVGSGPFMFVEYSRGEFLELERNPNYHLGRPYLDRVIIRVMDPQAAVAAMETGEVDGCLNSKIAVIPADMLDRLEQNPTINLVTFPTDSFDFIAMNFERGAPMTEVKFRQALSYAIDRESLVTAVERGRAIPGYTMLMPGSPYDNEDVDRYEYNPAKARDLLSEIGWDSSQTLVFGSPNDPRRSLIATILQQNFRDVGVDVDVEVYDFATLMSKADEGAFDIWQLGWGSGGIQYPGYTYFNMLHSSQWPPRWNFSRYSNPRIDELLALGQVTTDRESNIEIYHELQQIITEELPYIITMNKLGYSAINVRVQGFQDFIGGTTYNPHEWWIQP